MLNKDNAPQQPRDPQSETPSEALPEQTPAAGFPPVITSKELAQLWDVVIRAHYLAHELGDPCARSGLAAARMALSLSEVISCWASLFGEELEQLEARNRREAEAAQGQGEG